MDNDTIPFVDLYAQYQTIKSEIDTAIEQVITSSAFVRGPYVERFEEEFAEAVEGRFCITCGNGTDALYIAYIALGVRPGDEVIVPAHSWISTAEAVTQAGGKVVFCDTDAETYTIDPKRIEEKITPRTVGIVPVHLYGQPSDMDPIMAIAEKYGLWVVEDCAQAHLARYKGQQVGTFGAVGTYSFYPGKNLGAMGDGGAIITNDENLALKMTRFARHGGLKKGEHVIEGINSRLDGLQAAILSVKLKHLPKWTKARQEVASWYARELASLERLKLPTVAKGREHVWHLYVIQHEHRDDLAKHLKVNGVSTIINYPIALPFLQAYKHFGYTPEDYPIAYAHQSKILSLPIYPEISNVQMNKVAHSLGTFNPV